jgi:hypothetical protein
MNEDLLKLVKKINTVKKEVGKIIKDSENPYYKSKYTDINSLIEQLEPLLEKRKLVLLQPIKNGEVYSEIIDLESGQVITSSLALPTIADPQKIGSAITYYRRYTLTSLLALQSEDDDGNLASGKNLTSSKEGKKPKMVTMKQGKYLRNLGMKDEDIRKLTALEADKKIKLLTKKKNE